jgi:dihydroorotase
MTLTVKSPADFHVHLRQGTFSELITPHIRKGGFRLAYVMVAFSILSVDCTIMLSRFSSPTSNHRSQALTKLSNTKQNSKKLTQMSTI